MAWRCDRPMSSASADRVTLIHFGMGSADAVIVMDLLSAIGPQAALFLGRYSKVKRGASWVLRCCRLRRYVAKGPAMTVCTRHRQRCRSFSCSAPIPP